MALENLHYRRIVVLAGNYQHDATMIEFQGAFLESQVGISREIMSQGNARETDFAEDTSPESIIAIQSQDFADTSTGGTQQTNNLADVIPHKTRGNGRTCQEPHSRVCPAASSAAGRHAVNIDNMEVVYLPS